MNASNRSLFLEQYFTHDEAKKTMYDGNIKHERKKLPDFVSGSCRLNKFINLSFYKRLSWSPWIKEENLY